MLNNFFDQLGLFAKLTILAGVMPLVVAAMYAVRPAERKLAVMRVASLSAMFAGLSGVAIGLIAVLRGLAAEQARSLSPVYMGISEALAPAFLNFAFLAVAWLLIAAGMMRRTA